MLAFGIVLCVLAAACAVFAVGLLAISELVGGLLFLFFACIFVLLGVICFREAAKRKAFKVALGNIYALAQAWGRPVAYQYANVEISLEDIEFANTLAIGDRVDFIPEYNLAYANHAVRALVNGRFLGFMFRDRWGGTVLKWIQGGGVVFGIIQKLPRPYRVLSVYLILYQ